MRTAVVLPAPMRQSSAQTLPKGTSRLTSTSAWVSPNERARCCAEIAKLAIGGHSIAGLRESREPVPRGHRLPAALRSADRGDLRDESPGVNGAHPACEVVAVRCVETMHRVELPVLGEGHCVVAPGDINDARIA